MNNIKRLQLEGVYNVRELGGYHIDKFNMTKWNVFLRCADLATITKDDTDVIYAYGVRTIINLKAIGETENPIENDKRFKCIQVPLIDDFTKMFSIIKNYEGSFYLTILEAFKDQLKKIFNCIAEHINNGGILFHCISGKDRTGVVAMLLLMLAGTSDLDVIADYIVSAIYMRPDAIKRNLPFEAVLKYPEEIEYIMSVVKEKYGGAENYLKDIGVSTEAIKNIKNNFIGKLGERK